MEGIYRPAQKIAIASSFEGILNNGATECALTSFNAYSRMPEGEGKFFNRVVEPGNFGQIRDLEHVAAFLALRPLVSDAEDYVTVLQVIESSPQEVRAMLNDSGNEEAYRPLIEKFEDFKETGGELRERFGAGQESAFYVERKRMKQSSMRDWMATQEPYRGAIDQFRALIGTQERIEGAQDPYSAVKSGFVPWFATSKDEETAYLLCHIYTEDGRLDPDTVSEDGTSACVISRDRLVGIETVPSKKKVEQLSIIAEREGVEHQMVWRVEDRYDKKGQRELEDAGFLFHFIVPGYMFPHHIGKAREDRDVVVLDRENFAFQLGEFAKARGY